MSISAGTFKVQYTLTSAAQALVIPFYFIANTHVRVVRTRSSVDFVLTGGFTIAGAGVSSGGTLTLDGTQTTSGDRITIKRAIPLTQLIRYLANDRFPASTHERGLDEATMRAQQAHETADRGLRYGEGELMTSDHVLPGVASRGGRVLGFDDDGKLDLDTTLDQIRTLIIANPVNGLTSVTDYGSVGDPVDNVADYGSIA